MPVVRGHEHRAFPQRLGLRSAAPGVPKEYLSLFRRRRHGDKLLVDQRYYSGRVCREAPFRWLLAGTPPAPGAPEIRPLAAREALWPLARGLVFGVGTPQVLELLVPAPPFFPDALAAARIGCSRVLAAAAILRRCELLKFRLGPDAAANAALLAEFLESRRPRA